VFNYGAFLFMIQWQYFMGVFLMMLGVLEFSVFLICACDLGVLEYLQFIFCHFRHLLEMLLGVVCVKGITNCAFLCSWSFTLCWAFKWHPLDILLDKFCGRCVLGANLLS